MWQNPHRFRLGQNPHGFRLGQNGNVCEAKYKNMKEEALLNDYAPLSKDKWNEILSEAKVFLDNWNHNRIRSKCDGYFDD